MKKTLFIGLGIFLLIVVTIGVVYLVRKPATVTTMPTPTPVATVTPTAIPAPIFAIDPAVCKTSFTVACTTTSTAPSATVVASGSPTSSPSTPPSAALDCVSKKMYTDDSRNRAGFYYLEKEIVDTNTMQSGETIVYNVVTKNAGGNNAPDTTITDKLSTNLTYVDGDSGCTYDSTTRVVTCTVGTLSANSEAQRSFRAKVSVVGSASVANTADVTSTNGQRDSCSVSIDATGKVIPPTTVSSAAPAALPVAGVFEVTALPLGIGLLLLILGGLGLLLI